MAETPPPFSCLFCRSFQAGLCSDDPVAQKILETTRTVFENIKMMLSENCSCFLNLVISMFFMFFQNKKIGD